MALMAPAQGATEAMERAEASEIGVWKDRTSVPPVSSTERQAPLLPSGFPR